MERLTRFITVFDFGAAGLALAVGMYFLTVGQGSTAAWWLAGGVLGLLVAWLRPAVRVQRAMQRFLVRRA